VSQVNLLPPEIRQRQRVRQQTILVGIIGGAVVLLIVAFYFLQAYNVSQTQNDLAAQDQQNAQLQTQVQALSEFGDLQQALQDKRQLEGKVFEGEVAWSGVLMDVSRVIPAEAAIDSLSAQETATSTPGAAAGVPAPSTAVGGAAPGELIGTMTLSGAGAGVNALPAFLSQMEQVRGWANPYASDMSETSARSGNYTFSVTVDLTKDVLTARGRGEETP
jgi:Tfp pilus assembly protein PilN